ncbi:MAG: tetratricopeptide repeat protein [Bacteroidia bacterium]|nr:tetratricopeptide repeat protein [Bacteroidia bacterium]
MKKIIVLIILLLPGAGFIFSQVSNPVIIGTLKYNEKPADGVNVRLLKNDMEVDNITTSGIGKFTFTLNQNELYTIELFKTDFVIQKITISTKTASKSADGFLPLSITVAMIRMFSGFDTLFFRKPVMKIRYDEKQKGLAIDEGYQASVKKEYGNVMKKHAALKEKSFTEEIAKGDKFLKTKEYEEAWLCYDKATNYKPEEPYPKTKITEVKNIIFKQTTKEAAYKNAIANGDKLFNKNNPEARKYYEKALLYQPDAKHPSERIREVNEALDQFGYMKRQAFNNKIALAEDYLKNKYYEEALNVYQEANNLKPGNQNVLKKIDELKKIIRKNKNENAESMDAMNASGIINTKIENLQKELDIKEKSGNKKAVSEVMVSIGNSYYEAGNFGNSIEYYARSLKLKEETGDKKAVSVLYNNIGDIYATILNYEKAIENYQKALQTKEETGDKTGNEKILNKIGAMFYQEKNYSKAIDFFEKSYEIDERNGDKKNAASSLNNIGVAHYESGNYEKAVEYYEKALKMLEEIGSKKEISMSLNNLGNVNFDWKKFTKALDFYQKSLKYKEELHYEQGIVISLYNIANVYFETADYNNAIEFYARGKELSEKIKLTPYAYLNNKALAKVYCKINNFKKAYESLLAAKTMNEVLFDENTQKQISEIHYKYDEESREKEKKIENLEKQLAEQNLWVRFLNEKKVRDDDLYNKQRQIQKLKLAKERIISYSLFAGFLLLGIIALIFFNRYKIKKKANANLEKANNEILLEKQKSDQLLLNILPVKVATDLKEKGKSDPELYKNVSVVFADIVEFTKKSSVHEPHVIINELNEFFTALDDIVDLHHCERIKTIGDAYLAVCGMHIPVENHAGNIARVALGILKYAGERNNAAAIKWIIRIGIHTGEVVGGVVGTKKYIYDVFGDTINTASRLETCCEPMKINASEEIYEKLKDTFHFTFRGLIEAKGKGAINMYYLEGEKL